MVFNRCDDRRTRAAASKASLALAEVEPLSNWPGAAAAGLAKGARRLGGGGKPGGQLDFFLNKWFYSRFFLDFFLKTF